MNHDKLVSNILITVDYDDITFREIFEKCVFQNQLLQQIVILKVIIQ